MATTTLPLPSARNVTRIFRQASELHVKSGLAWYADAMRVAETLAGDYGIRNDQAAGILAALSPLHSWGANVALADRFLAGTRDSGYLSVGLAKARAILAGSDILDTLGSEKISNFYLCIVAGGRTDAVCIDRHAMDIAVNRRMSGSTRPKLKGARYAAFQAPYIRAAEIISRETGADWYAAQVQAVTWRAWRARFWSEGAFDGAFQKAAN